MPRWAAFVVGGWKVQASYARQSEFPLGFGNAIFTGNRPTF